VKHETLAEYVEALDPFEFPSYSKKLVALTLPLWKSISDLRYEVTQPSNRSQCLRDQTMRLYDAHFIWRVVHFQFFRRWNTDSLEKEATLSHIVVKKRSQQG
jgi:hypothetical protein